MRSGPSPDEAKTPFRGEPSLLGLTDETLTGNVMLPGPVTVISAPVNVETSIAMLSVQVMLNA